MQNCTDKFLKHSERVGARFAEHNAGAYGDGFTKIVRFLNLLSLLRAMCCILCFYRADVISTRRSGFRLLEINSLPPIHIYIIVAIEC